MDFPPQEQSATSGLSGSITNLMSSHARSAIAGDPTRGGSLYRVAIVGAATLKGKEVVEVLGDRNFPLLDTRMLDDDESLGQLESIADEISFIQNVRAEQFDHIDFTFFASDQDCTRKTWKTAQRAGSAIVDLSYALEDEPGAVVRSTWLERQLGQTLALQLQPGPAVVAHPAAVVLTLLLLRVRRVSQVRRAVATVFEPASERGQKGMDELHQQTVNLLSFQQLPKTVFDAQIAFNMVARYGPQSTPTLAAIENRILQHCTRIAGPDFPLPSLMLVQAPIFHGHAFAVHVEMEEAVDVNAVSEALKGEHVTVVPHAEEAPSNVNAAGQGDILVSAVADASQASSVWLWAASDNLRIAAATAVECAETMTVTRPKGKIQ
jgi:aspartate-semialdehyde dehydrogenase